MAQFIWDLKLENKQWEISWKIVKESKPYQRETKVCKLCEDEKLCILNLMKKEPARAINKRTDLLKSCPHIEKEMLASVEKYEHSEQIIEEQELQQSMDQGQEDQSLSQLNPNLEVLSQQVFNEHASSSQDRILTRAEMKRRIEVRLADYDPG